MAENESKYYYDLTPDAQDIDDALIDLTKILKKLEYGKAVILKAPDDEVLRSHFDLGDASKAIPGDEDVLIAADGNGNAKINEGNFYSKNNNDVATLQTSKSSIEIKGIQTGTEKYWSYGHGLKFHMDGESLLQMISQNSGSPILSMRGRSIVDIDSVYYGDSNPITAKRTNEAFWLSPAAGAYYDNVSSSLISGKKLCDDNIIYPLIQIKESSTVLMEGSPLVHICGGASLLMDGDADVRIRGAGYNKGTAYGEAGRTFFIVDPGSGFYMQTYCDFSENTIQPQYRPLFQMITSEVNKSQIILSCQGSVQTNKYSESDRYPYYYFSPDTGVRDLGNETRGFIREKTCGIESTDYISDLSNIQAPTFVVQGKTHITLGGEGTIGARISTFENLHFSWCSFGNEQIKIGSGKGSNVKWDISCGPGVNQHVKFGTDSGGNTAIAIDPRGDTSFKFSPENICGISFTPKYTDIVCQWDKLDAILDGKDTFIQHEGNGHFEFLNDSTIIMRGPSVERNTGKAYISTNGPAITIETNTDYTGYSFNEISDSDKQKFISKMNPNPSFSSIGKHYYDGGEFISDEYYSDRYMVKIEGGAQDDIYISFYSKNYYSDESSFIQSTVFQNYIKANYGPNVNVVSTSSFKGTWKSSQGKYYYKIRATLSNMLESFYSKMEYEIGTTYTNLTEIDQAKLNSDISHLYSQVTNIFVRTDMKYNTTFSNYRYITGTHLGKDWTLPIQSQTGPISQLYDLSNLCMRSSKTANSVVYTYTLTDYTETYDFSDSQYNLITKFLNSEDYITFLDSITIAIEMEIADIISLSENDEGGLFIEYITKPIGKNNNVIQKENSPVIELIGNSELRLSNGASINAETKWDKTFITFSGTTEEGEVSFTIEELKALKALLS